MAGLLWAGAICALSPSVQAKSDLATINAMDHSAFVQTLGAIFEKSPWVADAAWAKRPFADLGALHAAMVAIVANAPLPAQLVLLQAHPDLAGKEAQAGAMTASSVSEQSGAGLNRLSKDEVAEIGGLNAAYRTKFGFPFIIAVRTKTKDEILAAFRTRLTHDTRTEYDNDLENVSIIARLRLEKAIEAK